MICETHCSHKSTDSWHWNPKIHDVRVRKGHTRVFTNVALYDSLKQIQPNFCEFIRAAYFLMRRRTIKGAATRTSIPETGSGTMLNSNENAASLLKKLDPIVLAKPTAFASPIN